MTGDMPSLVVRFRPRADAALLSRLVQDAWRAEHDALAAQADALGIGGTVTAHVESRFPRDDMAVLARYGCAATASEATVRIYDPAAGDWANCVYVSLLRPVVVPSGRAECVACGPRWHDDPLHGCRPDQWAEMSEEDKRRVVEYRESEDRRSLPAHVDPYFARIVELRRLYRAEYRAATAWPTEAKAERGEWPTWGEVADRFPALGAYIRRGES